ncbi:hypothetical protein M405DRAFT_867708 [Rhizopogon salebrosus TDB-379]|nr:hypothetical protein M405DRAFT_867708 [Rhizopogon salebrosus TDB-379]
MSLNFLQPGLDTYRRLKLTHCCLYSNQIQQLARNQFSDLEYDDGLLEYPEDIFGTATLKASVETALADVERLGQKRAEKIAGLRIEEKDSDGLPLVSSASLNHLHTLTRHILPFTAHLYHVARDMPAHGHALVGHVPPPS